MLELANLIGFDSDALANDREQLASKKRNLKMVKRFKNIFQINALWNYLEIHYRR